MDSQIPNRNRKIFIANWKSHKDVNDSINFFETLSKSKDQINFENKTIIVAPPFPIITTVKEQILKFNFPFDTASQDISMFDEGAFTGEVSAKLIKTIADYSIIGHSERREHFKENDIVLFKKAEIALKFGLMPIYCVQNEGQNVPDGVEIVAYEPPTAIGTGNPDDPIHIQEVFDKIISKYQKVKVLYGGSVKAENIAEFNSIPNLSGFLVGGASLEPDSFLSLLSKW